MLFFFTILPSLFDIYTKRNEICKKDSLVELNAPAGF